MSDFNRMRERFGALYQGVRELHQSSLRAHRGHGFDHDVTVAQYVLNIAPDAHAGGMAWCAALLHSIDHLVGADNVEVKTCELAALIPHEIFTNAERGEIVEAAVRHAEKNRHDQKLCQQVLMDADRLANLQPVLLMRSGQYRPYIPVLDLAYLDEKPDPTSTYSEPRTVMDDVRLCIVEYRPQFRLPKAVELANIYIGQLERYMSELREAYKFLGLAGTQL